MSSVYLCGFMGCGKSHVGRQLAAALDREFIDLDRYIVNEERMTIPFIFEKHGEPYFRRLEAKYIRDLADNNIVATGGGALINGETAEYARQSGLSVYINASFEICYDRIKDDANRPLAVNSSKSELKKLYDTRDKIYRRNAMCMVNGCAADAVIVDEIAKLTRYFEENGHL